MEYTARERQLLSLYFSVLEKRDHADIYLVRNLPPEVAATLNGVYSRSSSSMRDNFLMRLKKGLAETGRDLEDMDVVEPPKDVLTDILADKSGKFLKTYAIDHGHNSLREGSVIHLAVENVSQLVTRFIQRERRCSFEESSTRYISFSNEGHWRDPDVRGAGGAAAAAYEGVIDSTFGLYERLTRELMEWMREKRPMRDGEQQGPYERALRAETFDAARYLLTPALKTKWGMVADARTLSDMITELASHPLAEFRLVGERLKQQADLAIHTLLAHAGPNAYQQELHRIIPELCRELAGERQPSPAPCEPSVELIGWDHDLDARLVASLLYEHSTRPLSWLVAKARALSHEQRASILERATEKRGPRDALPAALEGAEPFEFELLVDFGAYRDIGRHRKGYQQQQVLTVDHGFLVPPLLVEAGLDVEYREVVERAADLQRVVAAELPLAAGYVTPFAFLQRVRVIFDPRQVAYFIELRSGPEGHFAYRDIAIGMFRAVEKVSPLFARLIRAKVGSAFLGRMESEQGAEARRRARMIRAGDLPAE